MKTIDNEAAAYREHLRNLAVPAVDDAIAASVAEAPPLPEDLAARLIVLIRSVNSPVPREMVGSRRDLARHRRLGTSAAA